MVLLTPHTKEALMNKAKILSMLALTVCGLPAFADETNLVKNPSFEAGSTDWILSDPFTISPSWVHSGTHGIVTLCPASWCLDTVGVGAYARQTLATTAGASYDLSFWVLPMSDASEYSVFWDGALIADRVLPGNSSSMIFQQFTGLTAATSATVLEVHGRNAPSLVAFDDFAVFQSAAAVASPVPEPVAGSMLVAGLAVLGFMRRRRR
jgi:hypothetical protein